MKVSTESLPQAGSVRKRPRILYLVTEDWYFCSHRLPLACAALRAGFDVVVATRVQDHGRIILDAGLRLRSLKLRRAGKNPFSELRAISELIKIYRTEQPDIVHHVALKPVLYGSLAAWWARVPAVVNAITGTGFRLASSDLRARLVRPFINGALRLALNRAGSRVILQNPDDRDILGRNVLRNAKEVVLIRGSGVDLELFRPEPEPPDTPVVLLASRMLRDKGVVEFVKAARLLRGERVRARFVLVGDEDRANPSSLSPSWLERMQAEGVVEWWGHRTDMSNVFKASHIVCLPSYREGLPKVLLEAAASGRPIVTTDTPGCREVVRHGENGLLVPVREVEALANAIRVLLESPELRHRMGIRGRELVEEQFGIQKVIEETLRLYDELLSCQPHAAALASGVTM